MSHYLKQLGLRWEDYKEWVVFHPIRVSQIESIVKWSSLTLAGQAQISELSTEIVYVATRLMILCNDIIISEERRKTWVAPMETFSINKRNVEFALTVFHRIKDLIEIILREKCSERKRWIIITLIQLLRLAANLYLMLKHENVPVRCPPAPLRKPPPNDERWQQEFCLNRIRRNIKKINPDYWSPCNVSLTYYEWPIPPASQRQHIAEYLHVFKPLVHLASMALFGQNTWKQYFIALTIDLTSLYLHRSGYNQLCYTEKVEITRRKIHLLYYIMRSPLYQKFTERQMKRALIQMLRVKVIGVTFKSLLEHLDRVQSAYFYMWD